MLIPSWLKCSEACFYPLADNQGDIFLLTHVLWIWTIGLLLCSLRCPVGGGVGERGTAVMCEEFYTWSKRIVCVLGIRWQSDSDKGACYPRSYLCYL